MCVGVVTWQYGFPVDQSGRGGQAVGRAMGSACEGPALPKNRDWDPHGQHGKAKQNFIFLIQTGGMGSSCLSINRGDPISGHICLQELNIV